MNILIIIIAFLGGWWMHLLVDRLGSKLVIKLAASKIVEEVFTEEKMSQFRRKLIDKLLEIENKHQVQKDNG